MPRIHRRLREALTMESALVGAVATVLFVYLFFSLVRPERF
jgi:K+-transporting ATPase KdpF subunit